MESPVRLALFDLDNTLLAGDSDHLAGANGCASAAWSTPPNTRRNSAFYADYVADKLDVLAYQAFTQAILGRTGISQLETWHRQFMQEVIEADRAGQGRGAARAEHPRRRRPAGGHRRRNRFVSGPIAERLGWEP